MGLFNKKTGKTPKSDKMKTLRVRVASKKPPSKKPAKTQAFDLTQWIADYASMSKGNPV